MGERVEGATATVEENSSVRGTAHGDRRLRRVRRARERLLRRGARRRGSDSRQHDRSDENEKRTHVSFVLAQVEALQRIASDD